jgi:predicted hotdog family 3-hydroxylacyl-ACP dehydratase
MDFSHPQPLLPGELPHAGSMRWIHAVSLAPDGETAISQSVVRTDHPFVRNGLLLPTALIELLAQGAAAGSALRARVAGRRIKQGLLVGLRDFVILAPVVVSDVSGGTGVELTIRARHEKSYGPLSRAFVEVLSGDVAIARARMTFHLLFE